MSESYAAYNLMMVMTWAGIAAVIFGGFAIPQYLNAPEGAPIVNFTDSAYFDDLAAGMFAVSAISFIFMLLFLRGGNQVRP